MEARAKHATTERRARLWALWSSVGSAPVFALSLDRPRHATNSRQSLSHSSPIYHPPTHTHLELQILR